MSHSLRTTLGVGTVLLLIVSPLAFACYQQGQMRNFRVVREGMLYRSSQMTQGALKRVIHDYGIRTVVTLRDARNAGEEPKDLKEELYCKKEGLNHVRISPRPWSSPQQGPPPADINVRQFLAVMRNPRNYPVLVHCTAGIHRTGAMCAIFRMEFDGWSNERALAELKACGYTNLDDELDILEYLEQYRPNH